MTRKKTILIILLCWAASASMLILRFISINFVPSLLEPFRLFGVAALIFFGVGWATLLAKLR